MISEVKAQLKLALPIIFSQVAVMLVLLTDSVMASRFSISSLAALSVATSVLQPLLVLVTGIFVAINPIVSQANGKADIQDIKQTIESSVFLAFFLAVPSVLFLRNIEPLLNAFNIDPTIIPLTADYLTAVSWGVLPFFLFLIFRFLNEGMFRPSVVMFVNLASIPLNFCLNLVLIYGYFGLPKLGVTGIGYATSAVWILMLVMVMVYTKYIKSYKVLNLFTSFPKASIKKITEVVTIGLPIGLALFMEIGMFAAVGIIAGTIGVNAIAGHQIAMNVSSLLFMIPLGVSIALTTRVGFFYGEGDETSLLNAAAVGVILAISASILNILVLVTVANQIVAVYTNDILISVIAVKLLFFAAIFQLSDSIQVVLSGALRGLKDTKVPMLINGVAYWVIGIPFAYLFAVYLDYGVEGLWWGMFAGLTLSAILLVARVNKRIFKKYAVKPE